MADEQRLVSYDATLGLEAFQLCGFDEPFPQHVHDHYVFGLVERGERGLVYGGVEYHAQAGDVLMFNPGEAHGCVHVSDEPLTYRGINVPKETLMRDLTDAPAATLPHFAPPVITDEVAAALLRSLHQAIMHASPEADCTDAFGKLIAFLISWYSDDFSDGADAVSESPRRIVTRRDIEEICAYIQAHCCEQISLDELCAHIKVGRSTLMRAFVKEKGITPYLYVESMRIEQARTLLEAGVSLAEAATRTGFSDQSHFSHYFKRITGLTPGAYRSLFVGDDSAREDAPHD